MASPSDVKNVLVPLDGSELALQALPTARALAERLGGDLHSVTVANGDQEAERSRQLAAAALHVPVDDDHVFVTTEGDPAEAIAARAEALGIVRRMPRNPRTGAAQRRACRVRRKVRAVASQRAGRRARPDG